jgi:hypothetical protein
LVGISDKEVGSAHRDTHIRIIAGVGPAPPGSTLKRLRVLCSRRYHLLRAHRHDSSVRVGGEAVLGKGIGLGAEVGALGTRQYFADSVVGVFSPNGYYLFVHGNDIKIDPFVTGGYTLLFRSGHANLFNFCGGLNYWFRTTLGGRLEVRDQVHTDGSSVHYWEVRFGLAFR